MSYFLIQFERLKLIKHKTMWIGNLVRVCMYADKLVLLFGYYSIKFSKEFPHLKSQITWGHLTGKMKAVQGKYCQVVDWGPRRGYRELFFFFTLDCANRFGVVFHLWLLCHPALKLPGAFPASVLTIHVFFLQHGCSEHRVWQGLRALWILHKGTGEICFVHIYL